MKAWETTMTKVLTAVALSLLTVTSANAMSHRPHWTYSTANDTSHSSTSADDPSSPAAAPEIDPASALSGLTLLAGGLAVIRARRSAKRGRD
jgi:hypothetical protein